MRLCQNCLNCAHSDRMFFTQRLRVCPIYINASKRLISNRVKEVLSTRLEPPAGINGQLQLAVVSKNLNALNLDLFVNNLSPNEDRRSVVLDLMRRIRSSKLANDCLESTNFAVVRHLLDNSSIQELVPILLDRPQFGIFLDNFTGFAVSEALYNEQEYSLALPLMLKLVLLDELDSAFIQAFCVKSSLAALKTEIATEPKVEEEKKAPVGKQQEQKIRVKFLRNPLEYDVNLDIGKALLKISSCSNTWTEDMKDNAKLLGYILTRRYEDLTKSLESLATGISSDVLDIGKELLSRSNQMDLANKVAQVGAEKKASKLFEESIDVLLSESLITDGKLLAERQTQLFPTWQKLREEKKSAIEKEISEKERKENVEKITNEIANTKQMLWFFEEEDKLDLEIYNKQVFYPKRWFGKKKKPRVVDEHYVPPQIRKIN